MSRIRFDASERCVSRCKVLSPDTSAIRLWLRSRRVSAVRRSRFSMVAMSLCDRLSTASDRIEPQTSSISSALIRRIGMPPPPGPRLGGAASRGGRGGSIPGAPSGATY
eukprot:scaffold23365_cov115-Isochrysis_galbana.AAC.4